MRRNEQLDFPVVYTSAIGGYASLESDVTDGDMTALLQSIVDNVSPPDVDPDGPFQMQISALDYSSYVGAIGVGRITRGKVRPSMPVTLVDNDGKTRNGRTMQVLGFKGLERIEVEEATAGDIVAITGLEGIRISDTMCDPANVEALPPLSVDEPTVSMTFYVNNSPFAGKDGKYVTRSSD